MVTGMTPQARQAGLQRLVEEAEALVRWGQQHSGAATQEPPLRGALADMARLMTQDLEPDPCGSWQTAAGGARHVIVCPLWEIVRCAMGAKAKRIPVRETNVTCSICSAPHWWWMPWPARQPA